MVTIILRCHFYLLNIYEPIVCLLAEHYQNTTIARPPYENLWRIVEETRVLVERW